MIRSAAKNHARVTVVVDPADYARVLDEMAAHGGATSLERASAGGQGLRPHRRLRRRDRGWFADRSASARPRGAAIGGRLAQALRYGENPHQSAAFYLTGEPPPGRRDGACSIQGKELSFNNLVDVDAALELVREFDEPPAVDRQAHQPLRRRPRRDAGRGLRKALALRPRQRLRRHRRAQPPARRGDRACDRRPSSEVVIAPEATPRGAGIFAQEEEPAPADHRRPARSALARPRPSARSPAASSCSRATSPWSTTAS